jgi:hypothetical protein
MKILESNFPYQGAGGMMSQKNNSPYQAELLIRHMPVLRESWK